MKEKNESELTFWDHLDELRATLMRIACVVVVLMLLSFFFKDELFHIILMPKNSDFYIYRFFEWIGTSLHIPGLEANDFHVRLINTKLSGQFLMHMNVSFYAGIILASPYILYRKHSIFRHDNFIGCFSADKIKMSARKYFCFNIPIDKNMAEGLFCRSPYHEEYIQTSASGNPEDLCH